MQTVTDLMDAARVKLDLPSDYALAKRLEFTRAAMSRWRNGHDAPGDANAIRLAEMLDLDPLYVMAICHAKREKEADVRRMWRRLARLAKKGIAASYITFLAVGLMSAGPAATDPQEANFLLTVYTLYACGWITSSRKRLCRIARNSVTRVTLAFRRHQYTEVGSHG